MTIGDYVMGNSRKRLYEVHDYEGNYLLDQIEDSTEERIEKLRDKNIAKYRVKTIKSGNMLEVEAYPLTYIPNGSRGRKKNESREAQRKLNDKNTVKHIKRIVHTNFSEGDVWSTWPYENDKLPTSPEEAKKDMTNFIRRQKHWLKKQEKYKSFELKYIYVTEFDDTPGKEVRIHHHMISNFPDRDVLEDLWKGGGRVQTRRLRADEHGFEGIVRYILKEKKAQKTKRYTISRNMKKPKITVADSKMTRKRAERIATEEVSAHEVFEKMYKGYQFNDIDIKFSDFVSGAYLYVRMKRIEPIQQTRKRE